MNGWLNTVLIFVILMTLTLLGTGRLAFGIRTLALQGIALGLVPILISDQPLTWRVGLLAMAGIGLKGIVFPRMLRRAQRDAEVRYEESPWLGYSASVAVGVAMLALSLWLARRLPHHGPSSLPLAVALFTLLAGLFLIVSRDLALSQVLGYLLLENGVFLAGLALAREEPLLVEMGVLLDVFGAVLVMGVAIFHISRTFDSIEVGQMTSLKD